MKKEDKNMNLLQKIFLQGILVLLCGFFAASIAHAGTTYVSPYPPAYYPYPAYYYPPVYAPPTVVITNPPLVVPFIGSNDAHYQFDNIYGPGASAAGRMSHSVHNPQPFLFISR